ncbi:hypothetical protein LJC55_03030 [Eubacteriales bacterium OttesenSCG-928-N14]|nr:hypothetical protein [Eubacteriales bacterium OttesenSCG-928-N14]
MIRPIDTKIVVQRTADLAGQAAQQVRQAEVNATNMARENIRRVEEEMDEVVNINETEGNIIERDKRNQEQAEQQAKEEADRVEAERIEKEMAELGEAGESDSLIDIRI